MSLKKIMLNRQIRIFQETDDRTNLILQYLERDLDKTINSMAVIDGIPARKTWEFTHRLAGQKIGMV